MSWFHVEFATANASFVDDDRDQEIARILRAVGDWVEEFGAPNENRPLFDSNGNRVGFFEWHEGSES